ncbi:hypothetical protein KL911_001021 [Ogataea haglerorum]|uniref:uncharacterized protein n=1 Tax=Ogataea haglerorum TaxID=1937702 RepID=UPI001C897AC8|nr:uncharacterized protein KL911_001021 [Ogataea haglerorum]KAG7758045.1 hypothetical protein KL911_001021 [Ogataea haglerorum]
MIELMAHELNTHDLSDVLDLLRVLSELGSNSDVDKLKLREIRILWQVILGIDEHLFDQLQYTNLSLEIRSHLGRASFQCLRGNDHHTEFPVQNAVGDVLLTKSLIRSIEEETGPHLRQNITQELSMINKIRLVLFELENVVSNLSTKSRLMDCVSQAYEYELYYHRKAGQLLEDTNSGLMKEEESLVPLMFETNNESFNTCYKQSLLMLTASVPSGAPAPSKIQKAARLTVETFMSINCVKVIYDLQLVSEYHLRIFNTIKYPLRNAQNRDVLERKIDDYLSLNPIIPILKPIIRQLMQNDQRDTNDEDVTEILNLIDRVLARYMERKKAPLSVRWFTRILEKYIDLLREDGQSLSDDIYYQEVRRAALKWNKKEVTPNSFEEDLLALSLIPSSEMFSFRGQQLPSAGMRYALVCVKKEVELKSKYLRLWFDSMTYVRTDRELLNIWKKSIISTFLKKWYDKSQLYLVKNQDAIQIRNTKLLRNQIQKWVRQVERRTRSRHKADLFALSKMFLKWKQKYERFKECTRPDGKESFFLKKRFFRLWRTASMARSSKLSMINDKMTLQLMLTRWHQKFRNHRQLIWRADQARDVLIKSHYFNVWLNESAPGLKKAKRLQYYEDRFIQANYFHGWVMAYNFHILEGELCSKNNRHLVHWIFENWKQFYRHQKVYKEYIERRNAEILVTFFNKWNTARRLLSVADDFRRQSLLQRVLGHWKLVLQESKVYRQREAIILKKYMQTWRLRTREDVFLQGGADRLTQKMFERWYSLTVTRSNHQRKAEKFRSTFTKKSILRFWFSKLAHSRDLLVRAEEWRLERDEEHERKLISTVMEAWIKAFQKAQEKNMNLEVQLADFETSHCEARILNLWKKKWEDHVRDDQDARSFRTLSLETKMFNKWLRGYDRILELNEICDHHLEVSNVDLLSHIVSQMSLKAIKIQNDLRNADRFKERWSRNKKRVFFDIWKFSYEEKKNNREDVFVDTNEISSLSPLAQRRRFTGIVPETPGVSSGTPGRWLRTPAVARTNSIPATERVRRMYLEQRRSQYRQVKQRSPEKGDISTPTRRVRTERTYLDEDNVFIQRDEI